jgi:hypothetical protein
MKGNSGISVKILRKRPLHMKENSKKLKLNSFLTFPKWTKKNVQKSYVKNGLTEKIFCLGKFILSSYFKPKNKKNVTKNFIFFAEKGLGRFSTII